jgi:Na+/phosphate symporter
MTAAPKHTTDIETLFSAISEYIANSNALLEKGALLELKGLDDSVQLMCDTLVAMSQDQRVQYADKLQQLQEDLNKLGQTIVTMRDKLGSEILGTGEHKRASVAYRKGETDKQE